jgi:hypothetical protein
MKPSHKLVRRSFLASVVGGAAAAAFLPGQAGAQNVRYSGVTDCDSGSGADRPGYGTGDRTQHTDSDTGPTGDARCHGRGTSSGSSSGTQYPGRTATGCSDRDYGQYGDPSGYGRRCRGETPDPRARQPSGCTDSDRGANADSVGNGRVCTPR